MFDNEMIDEFKVEVLDILLEAESALLDLSKGNNFSKKYNEVFRAFHLIKGGAGMLGLEEVQKHTHFLENLLQEFSDSESMPEVAIDYFLKGIDLTRSILDGENVSFDYVSKDELVKNPKPSSNIEIANRNHSKKSLGYLYIVDDEVDIRDILNDIVEQAGYEAQCFADGLQAFEAISDKNNQRPDCILLDMSMPNMSGMEFLKRVQKIDPDIPVIFISGHLSKADVIESISYGVYAILEKPFKPVQVISLVTNAVKKNRIMKLLNRSIKFMFYQFSDLDSFLASEGKHEIRRVLKSVIEGLIQMKSKLRSLEKGDNTDD